MCGSTDLHRFLDLGFTPPADQFRRKDQLREPDVYYPLQVMVCDGCGLAQLSHVVSPEVLYRNDYPYDHAHRPGALDGIRHQRDQAPGPGG
jgi:hypothetical protein